MLAQLAKQQQGMAQIAAHDYLIGGSTEEVEGGEKSGEKRIRLGVIGWK